MKRPLELFVAPAVLLFAVAITLAACSIDDNVTRADSASPTTPSATAIPTPSPPTAVAPDLSNAPVLAATYGDCFSLPELSQGDGTTPAAEQTLELRGAEVVDCAAAHQGEIFAVLGADEDQGDCMSGLASMRSESGGYPVPDDGVALLANGRTADDPDACVLASPSGALIGSFTEAFNLQVATGIAETFESNDCRALPGTVVDADKPFLCRHEAEDRAPSIISFGCGDLPRLRMVDDARLDTPTNIVGFVGETWFEDPDGTAMDRCRGGS